ncbi:uncharacterized protein LOC111342736 isoform X1 [Stylophora pistillata]|uniref:uncharacterized protein LOC111342736 isoform X1 n=1 Tax=Stylophora pistillata TaxID=50429 RepID=UPI000C0500FE|nr:uncharacterized protein LOC111342736 isoform X1 [Stylophora pistillata]
MLIDLSRNKPTVGFHCHSVTSFHHLSIMAARGHYEYGKKAEDFVRRFEEIIHLFEDRLLSEVRNQLTLTRPECEELMEVTASQHCKAYNVIGSLPWRVWRELMIQLDPLRPLEGDFRDLAGRLGFHVKRILEFESMPYPTQAVLKDSWNVTIEDLVVKLEEIGREDVKGIMIKWLRENCQCATCRDEQPDQFIN